MIYIVFLNLISFLKIGASFSFIEDKNIFCGFSKENNVLARIIINKEVKQDIKNRALILEEEFLCLLICRLSIMR